MGERILVAGPSWVGDFVMADALFKLLRSERPSCPLDVLAPAWALPLARRMDEVSEAIELPGGHGELAFAARWRLSRALRGRGYTHAYVLPRSAKAALVPWLARVPWRTGYLGEMRYGLLNDVRRPDPAHETVVQRYAALAQAPGAPLPESLPAPALHSPEAAQRELLARLGLQDDTRPVALCPGAEYGPAKRWPAEAYAALAECLLGAGRAVWLLGSGRERELGDAIAARAPGARNLAGATSLVEAVDLLAAAAAVVTNDSGLMHIAAALAKPLVAIFGSSSPRYTPPTSEAARIIYHSLPCSPCFARECPLGHLNCLRGIGIDEVMGALRRLSVA